MALVSYSDSEASDSEIESTKINPPAPAATSTSKTPATANFQVDRSNPRKIRVTLPDLKPENPESEDGPARKKPRIGGGGGGAFAGFNSFLPAPKRNNTAAPTGTGTEKKAPARKVFSLKTGAAPGFDREADAEMRRDQSFAALSSGANNESGHDDEFIPKAGSLRGEDGEDTESKTNSAGLSEMKPPEEVKLKGNPMMFKPLSVGRTQPKKRKVVSNVASTTTTKPTSTSTPTALEDGKAGGGLGAPNSTPQSTTPAAPPLAPKPKVSLFSLSAGDSAADAASAQASTTYEPLVYTSTDSAPSTGPQPDPETTPAPPTATANYSANTLDNIANDLNLSRSQRRQLFGRNADASTSRILHFDTDREYAANQELLHQTDLAAAQHNPVRAIAPGKHTLQQLVNSAQSQREALEESFASGKRNKKEAGAKYGW